jgi:hypothetical protein
VCLRWRGLAARGVLLTSKNPASCAFSMLAPGAAPGPRVTGREPCRSSLIAAWLSAAACAKTRVSFRSDLSASRLLHEISFSISLQNIRLERHVCTGLTHSKKDWPDSCTAGRCTAMLQSRQCPQEAVAFAKGKKNGCMGPAYEVCARSSGRARERPPAAIA